MLIRVGYHIEIELPQPAPIQTILDVHPTRAHDVVSIPMTCNPPWPSSVTRMPSVTSPALSRPLEVW